MFLGDAPGSNAAISMKSTSANHPCRMCEEHKSNFKTDHTLPVNFRDLKGTIDYLHQLLEKFTDTHERGVAQAQLKDKGLKEHMVCTIE